MVVKSRIFINIIILIFLLDLFCSCSKNKVEKSDEDWSFVVFGDHRQGYGVYGKLVKYISNYEPAPKFAVSLGDIMLRPGNEAEWLNFWRYSKPLTDKMPLFIVRGTHEGNDPVSEQILHEQANIPGENFYYSYCCEDAYFIILDTEIRGQERSIVNEQLFWLTDNLDSIAQESNIKNIFIFMHHPLFTQGKYQDVPLINAEELHELFLENNKVKTIFAGHEHIFNRYERDGLTYIISGGGGAILHHGYGGDYYHFVKVSFYQEEERINIKTIGIFNEVVEEFDL